MPSQEGKSTGEAAPRRRDNATSRSGSERPRNEKRGRQTTARETAANGGKRSPDRWIASSETQEGAGSTATQTRSEHDHRNHNGTSEGTRTRQEAEGGINGSEQRERRKVRPLTTTRKRARGTRRCAQTKSASGESRSTERESRQCGAQPRVAGNDRAGRRHRNGPPRRGEPGRLRDDRRDIRVPERSTNADREERRRKAPSKRIRRRSDREKRGRNSDTGSAEGAVGYAARGIAATEAERAAQRPVEEDTAAGSRHRADAGGRRQDTKPVGQQAANPIAEHDS